MDLMEETGLFTYVGKINMDRSSPDELVEESAERGRLNGFVSFGLTVRSMAIATISMICLVMKI